MLFYDRADCINPSPYIDEYGTKSGIFIIKNAVPKELIEKIEKQLKAMPEELNKFDQTLINWYSEKVIYGIDGTMDLWELVSELIGPEWVTHPNVSYIRVQPGDNGMFIHSDSPGKGACHLLSQADRWNTCCLLDYGLCVYLGDYEGGEIFYPSINPDGTIKSQGNSQEGCFEYKPEKGDIVIHSAFEPYSHGVREVKSGTRFVFSNFVLKAKDNPGTFYNYGTQEYKDQIGDKSPEKIDIWHTPLKENPQFTQEKIKIYQESGLEGEDLAKEFFSDMVEDI
jgi:hypothetical protein